MIDAAYLKHQLTLAVAALGLALVAIAPFVITGLAG